LKLIGARETWTIAIVTAGALMISPCSVIDDKSHPSGESVAAAIGKVGTVADSSEEENVTTFQGTELPLEVIEDALEPIDDTSDPSEFDFEENVDLDESEIAERFTDISDNYELGEPLSLSDLELVRAYAPITIPDPSEGGSDALSPLPVSSAAYFVGKTGGGVALAKINWWTGNGSKAFSEAKKSQGVSAKLTGTIYVNTKRNGIGNTWRIKSTGAIIAGKTNVSKNTVSLTFNGYGAVARWPYVGLIYTKTAKGSNGKNNVSIDQSYAYSALLASWSAVPMQSVKTKKGSFNVTI